MGSWDYSQIGFRCDAKNREQVKNLLECFGVDFEEKYGEIVERFNALKLDDYGLYPGGYDSEMVFAIVNRMFGDTAIFYERENGNTICDAYNRYEKMYDPIEKIVYCGEAEYCQDGYQVFGTSVFYSMIKEACEEVAKAKSIPVNWKRVGYQYRPGSDEFEDVCMEVLCEHGGIESLGRRAYTEPIPDVEIDTDTIHRLIDDAAKQGHNSLSVLISEFFDVDYRSPYMSGLSDEESRRNKRLYRRYRDAVLRIKEYDKDLKNKDSSLYDWFKECDPKTVDALKDGSVLRIKSYPVLSCVVFAKIYHGDVLIGEVDAKLFPEEALGLNEDVFLWPVITKKKGRVGFRYEHKLLDLDFDRLKDDILKKVGRQHTFECQEGVADYLKPNPIDGDYIKGLRTGKYYDRKELLKVASFLHLDILEYDNGV